jgi:hypothetical protein
MSELSFFLSLQTMGRKPKGKKRKITEYVRVKASVRV